MTRWMYWLVSATGVWLIISPIVVPGHGLAEAAVWSDVAAGALIVMVAGWALARGRWGQPPLLTLGALGLYLVAAPVVLAFAHVRPATWDSIVVGVLVVFVATVGGLRALDEAAG